MEVLGLNINISSLKATYNPNMLRYAIIHDDADSVKMYIEAGVDLTLKDVFGQTAMEAALKYRRVNIMRLLQVKHNKTGYNVAC